MSRQTSSRASGSTHLVADAVDLKSYVDRRLGTHDFALEPAWFTAAFDASWPLAFGDAESWRI